MSEVGAIEQSFDFVGNRPFGGAQSDAAQPDGVERQQVTLVDFGDAALFGFRCKNQDD